MNNKARLFNQTMDQQAKDRATQAEIAQLKDRIRELEEENAALRRHPAIADDLATAAAAREEPGAA